MDKLVLKSVPVVSVVPSFFTDSQGNTVNMYKVFVCDYRGVVFPVNTLKVVNAGDKVDIAVFFTSKGISLKLA